MSIEESAGLFNETGRPLVSVPETFGEDMVRPLCSGRDGRCGWGIACGLLETGASSTLEPRGVCALGKRIEQ